MTKILLVEDDKSLREIYGTRLLAESYDIVSAGDGEEALAMAIKEKPDLIISDVMMPKISGFDMLDILRSTTETRDIKVIMMTALSSDDQRTRGGQLGADKYLVKSQVGIEDVVRTVHEILGDSGAAPAAGSPSEPAPSTDTPAPAADSATTDSSDPVDSSTPAESSSPADAPSVDNASDTSDSTVAASGSAPGNDDAGPLPPQPSEGAPLVESALPEPTAPFSSPRPANLGENALSPETPEAPAAPSDLSAPEAAPVADLSSPVDAQAPADTNTGLGFEATPVNPVMPSVDPSPAVSPESPATPEVTPPSEENKDSTPPTIGPISTSV